MKSSAGLLSGNAPCLDKQKYQFGKLARRKTGYPLATIAYYGPDQLFASKVAVGIKFSDQEEEVTELRRWFAQDQDVRHDQMILQEIISYIETHLVHRVVAVDRIIGCPHKEGVDYPMGENCPVCPYWANRDRWTGELLSESE